MGRACQETSVKSCKEREYRRRCDAQLRESTWHSLDSSNRNLIASANTEVPKCWLKSHQYPGDRGDKSRKCPSAMEASSCRTLRTTP